MARYRYDVVLEDNVIRLYRFQIKNEYPHNTVHSFTLPLSSEDWVDSIETSLKFFIKAEEILRKGQNCCDELHFLARKSLDYNFRTADFLLADNRYGTKNTLIMVDKFIKILCKLSCRVK